MGNCSDYLGAKILNENFRGAAVYLALYLNDPTSADTGTEVTGGAYARQPISFGAAVKDGSRMSISNAQAIEFPVATSDWGLVSFYTIRDAATGGNQLANGAFLRSESINNGNKFTVQIGAVKVTQE